MCWDQMDYIRPLRFFSDERHALPWSYSHCEIRRDLPCPCSTLWTSPSRCHVVAVIAPVMDSSKGWSLFLGSPWLTSMQLRSFLRGKKVEQVNAYGALVALEIRVFRAERLRSLFSKAGYWWILVIPGLKAAWNPCQVVTSLDTGRHFPVVVH